MPAFDPWYRWFAWRPVRLSELRGAYFVETGKWAWWRDVWRVDTCYPIHADTDVTLDGNPIFFDDSLNDRSMVFQSFPWELRYDWWP